MKKLIIFFMPVMAFAFSVYASDNTNSNWELVMSDEFEKDGKLNPDLWDYERGFVRNQEAQWYQPENAYCQNGLLVLEGRKERVKNPAYKEGSKSWYTSREFAQYTAASVVTKKKFEFKYGRIEVRARIPFGKGAWPAIWTLGTSAYSSNPETQLSWPSCGEVDIMEFYRIKGVPTILANFAWSGTDKNGKRVAIWNDKKIPLKHFQEKDADWLANFHTWRMDWDEKSMKIYLDDELLNEMDLEKTFNGAEGKSKNPFRMPHYLLLNLAMGGKSDKGKIDDNACPMRYEIDYVRIYRKK